MGHRSGFAQAGAVFAAVVLAATWIPAAAAAAAPASPAQPRTIGEIRGRVVEQTAPAHPVAAQPVRLEIVEPAASSTRSTTTDAEGRFAFSGLPVGGEPAGGTRIFLVEVEYGGVPYTTRITLSDASPAREVPVSVFVATSDRSAVRGTAAFAVFELVRNALRVSIIQRLDNDTDQAVAITSADPLVFPLPALSPTPRAPAPVEFVSGWRDPRVNNTTITDTMPVLPGATEVAYAFTVAARARAETLQWNLPYGAANVDILADPSLRISGPDLQADGMVTERGRQYARWSTAAVPANGAVSVRVEGLPVPFDRGPWVAGALALMLAGSLAMVLRRGPARPVKRASPVRRREPAR